jgi:hypothetical protein
MRKLIDSNQLQAEALNRYLAASPSNTAVLCDYAAMEAHKGDTLTSIFRSMNILSDYPSQVVVLKSTRLVCGLRGRSAGLQRRMIDEAATSEFRDYVSALKAARNGDLKLRGQLLKCGRDADVHLQKMLADAETVAQAFEEITAVYSKTERAIVRAGQPYSDKMVDRVIQDVIAISGILWGAHPSVKHRPTFEELPNTFIFRTALCTYLLALDWTANGGAQNASPVKLRNDLVDMHFAAYGTYFDGLLSADAKVGRIYTEACIWLSALFRCAIPIDVTRALGLSIKGQG